MMIIAVLIAQVLLFFSGFSTYFHQDDFIDLSLSQNWGQVAKAFNIFSPAFDFQFYRPISVQLYFFINKTLFGWNVLGYHIVTMAVLFGASVLVYLLAKRIFKNKTIALLSMAFFALNPTHFAAANSAAYAHETLLVIFAVSSVYLLDLFAEHGKIKHLFFGLLFFICALATKETAVVIPGLLVLVSGFRTKKLFDKRVVLIVLITIAILGVYMFSHIKFYGMPVNSSYKIILGKPTLAISCWYFIWALGAPNFLIDFVGSKFSLSQTFWLVTDLNGVAFITFFGTLLISLATGLFYLAKQGLEKIFPIVVFTLWFLVAIIPVAIFPLHKLAIEQTLGLVGVSMVLAWIVYNLRGKAPLMASLILPLFLINTVNTVIMAQRNHWIPVSANLAKRTITLLNQRTNIIPNNSTIYFSDGLVKVAAWGSSRQIYYATGNGKGLELIFKNKGWKFIFEDQADKKNVSDPHSIIINADEVFSMP